MAVSAASTLDRGTGISEAVRACLETERELGLRARSLRTCGGYLRQFADYCLRQGVATASELSTALVTGFVAERGASGGPALVKSLVWSVRKLCAYLCLRGVLAENPARDLRHPPISPRAELPEYLNAAQLRHLLQSAARDRPIQDFAILSLIATTGLRSFEVAGLRRDELYLQQHRIAAETKGGWIKKTPLCASTAAVLAAHLAARDDDDPALFLNKWGQPATPNWVQRMVKEAARDAGLPFVTARVLRHTFGTFAADRHGTIVTRALLGHRFCRTTQVYTHLSPRRFRPLMNAHPYQTVIEGQAQR